MSLTRKMLEAMGIESNKIEQIMEAHGETVDALKEQRNQYKVDAEKLPAVQKELDDMKAAADDGYKEKYETEHTAFEKYKQQVAGEKANEVKANLYRKLLEDLKMDPKHIDAVMKVTDLTDVSIKDDKLENADKLTEAIKKEWSAFLPSTKVGGANVDNPPEDNPTDKDPFEIGFDEG